MYEVLSLLSARGMGEAYRARDTKLARDVAIKSVSKTFTDDLERVEDFDRKARLITGLKHPHIASFYGLEYIDGAMYLTMEVIDGQTLAERLSNGALSVPDALKIATQIASALQAAHEKGIVHGDLKPANIALTPEGQAKILDFGLSAALLPYDDEWVRFARDPTASPIAVAQAMAALHATPYMSPAQARGWCANERSDVWSFACVLYEMLAGRAAFANAENASRTGPAALSRDPDWPALPPSVPRHIIALLRGCLTHDSETHISDFAAVRLVTREGRPRFVVWKRIESLCRWFLRRSDR